MPDVSITNADWKMGVSEKKYEFRYVPQSEKRKLYTKLKKLTPPMINLFNV